MSTIIHVPAETNTVPDLYEGDHNGAFYSKAWLPGATGIGGIPWEAETNASQPAS